MVKRESSIVNLPRLAGPIVNPAFSPKKIFLLPGHLLFYLFIGQNLHPA
jgi:hypothetical protein